MMQVMKQIFLDPIFKYAFCLIILGIFIILSVVLLRDKNIRNFYYTDKDGNGYFYIQLTDNKDKSYKLTYTNNQNVSNDKTIYSEDGRMFYNNMEDLNTSKTALFVLDGNDNFNYQGQSWMPSGPSPSFFVGIFFGALFLLFGLWIIVKISPKKEDDKKINDVQKKLR